MSKYIAPILTIAIVAALAGVLYIRANVERADDSGSRVEEEKPHEDNGSAVIWSVQSPGKDPVVYDYLVGNKKTEGPFTIFEGTGVVRFNQSSDLCGGMAITPLTMECDLDENNILVLSVRDETDNGRSVLQTTIDPSQFGFTSAADGYLVPVAVANDKSTIYLGRRVEIESYVAGLWKLDVATGNLSEISYVREHNLYQYDINPETKQLLGVTFVPPESLGDELSAPTSVHLVDLATGNGDQTYGRDGGRAFENPMLSDDATRYAFYASDPLDPGTTIDVFSGSMNVHVNGIMKDWFGDTVAFDRDGNLFLYDLKTKTETQLTHETDASVEYLGVVR
jgi:hypothetical protein